jgi:hypothetical protein
MTVSKRALTRECNGTLHCLSGTRGVGQDLITGIRLPLRPLIFLALWPPGRTIQQKACVRQHRACAVQALCGVARVGDTESTVHIAFRSLWPSGSSGENMAHVRYFRAYYREASELPKVRWS